MQLWLIIIAACLCQSSALTVAEQAAKDAAAPAALAADKAVAAAEAKAAAAKAAADKTAAKAAAAVAKAAALKAEDEEAAAAIKNDEKMAAMSGNKKVKKALKKAVKAEKSVEKKAAKGEKKAEKKAAKAEKKAAAKGAVAAKAAAVVVGLQPRPATKAEGSSASVILLGGIAFLFALYYMVNSPYPEVQTQTWSAISAAVSIFIAVMANTMVNNFVSYTSEVKEEKATTETCVALALKLAITTFVVCLALFLQRASKLRLSAYGVIGGHILGFGAIDLFATVAGLPTFNSSPWTTLLVFVIYVVAVQVLVFPVTKTVGIFGTLCSGADSSDEELEAAEDQAKDTATDFYCMGASFLLAMWIRGMIVGKVVELEAKAKHRTSTDVAFLALAGIVFGLLAGVLRTLQHKATDKKGNAVALLEIVGTTASLASAWCLLDAGNWHCLEQYKDEMIGHVAVAIGASLFFIVAVHFMAMVIKHVGSNVKNTLRGEFTAVGLLLGLAWEHVFDAALEGIEPMFPEKHRATSLGFFTLVLVLFVFPAWVVYIVPKHDNGKSTGVSEGISPLTAFCDCEDEESEDEEAGLE